MFIVITVLFVLIALQFWNINKALDGIFKQLSDTEKEVDKINERIIEKNDFIQKVIDNSKGINDLNQKLIDCNEKLIKEIKTKDGSN